MWSLAHNRSRRKRPSATRANQKKLYLYAKHKNTISISRSHADPIGFSNRKYYALVLPNARVLEVTEPPLRKPSKKPRIAWTITFHEHVTFASFRKTSFDILVHADIFHTPIYIGTEHFSRSLRGKKMSHFGPLLGHSGTFPKMVYTNSKWKRKKRAKNRQLFFLKQIRPEDHPSVDSAVETVCTGSTVYRLVPGGVIYYFRYNLYCKTHATCVWTAATCEKRPVTCENRTFRWITLREK
jgi:hypothetical protein